MKTRILSSGLIIFSFFGLFFFEANEVFVFPAIVGFIFLSINLIISLKKRTKKVAFLVSFSSSLLILFGAPLIANINFNLALALFIEGIFSIFLPIFLFGALLFDHFRPKLVNKFAVSDKSEFKREDGVLLKSVAFFQSTFFILNGKNLLNADVWFISSFLIANILFFVFRGYAMIKLSNRNRYRSIVILLSIPALDILFILRDWIIAVFPLFTAPIVVPIPVNLTVLTLTLMVFGLVFGLLRVMLLARYELPEKVFF